MADSVGRVFALESLLVHGGRCGCEKPRAGVRPGIVTQGIFLSRKMLCFFFRGSVLPELAPESGVAKSGSCALECHIPYFKVGYVAFGSTGRLKSYTMLGKRLQEPT